MTTYKIEIQELLSRIIEIEAPPLPRLQRGNGSAFVTQNIKGDNSRNARTASDTL